MVKVMTHILAAIGIGYCLYRTAKKALNDPPDEERCYESHAAAILDGAADDDDWFLEAPEGY